MGWHGTTKTLQKFCKTHLSLDFTGLMVRHGIVWDVKNPSPKTGILHTWCPLQDLNPPPPDYKSGALPDELNGQELNYAKLQKSGQVYFLLSVNLS